MKNILISGFGRIVHFRDFVEIVRADGVVTYNQTNDQNEVGRGHNKRIIGIHKTADAKFVVGVAVGNVNDESLNSSTGMSVVISRITDLVKKNEMSMGPNDRGITFVPEPYLEMLIYNPYVFSNISGPIDEESLAIAVDTLNSLEDKYLCKQRSQAYANLKQQRAINRKRSRK